MIPPNDKFAYVTNKEGESVSVIDLTTNPQLPSSQPEVFVERLHLDDDRLRSMVGAAAVIASRWS